MNASNVKKKKKIWEDGLVFPIVIFINFNNMHVINPPEPSGDVGSVTELGRSPGVGNGHPLQYPCLENPMYRGAWLTIHVKGSSECFHPKVLNI